MHSLRLLHSLLNYIFQQRQLLAIQTSKNVIIIILIYCCIFGRFGRRTICKFAIFIILLMKRESILENKNESIYIIVHNDKNSVRLLKLFGNYVEH